MNTYLTIGTDVILEDKMVSVKDSSLHGSIKPSGGLWMTEFDMSMPTYNRWVDYIISHPYILFYKNKSSNPFCQPCSIVSLKNSANIFNLGNVDEYNELVRNYPSDIGFSFEKMVNDFDGIYINLFFLGSSLSNQDMNLFSTFGENSYILFNLDCIDYYYAGKVNIEPFDYEGGMPSFVSYDIEWDTEKKYIRERKK